MDSCLKYPLVATLQYPTTVTLYEDEDTDGNVDPGGVGSPIGLLLALTYAS